MKKSLIGIAILAVAVAAVVKFLPSTDDKPQQATRRASATVVRTVEAQEETIDIAVESTGTVRANEAIEITSQVAALVTAIRFKEGDRVAKGDILVELDGAQARAALAEAESALANSRSMHRRGLELSTSAALSKAQLQQLEADLLRDEARVAAAQARLAETVIRAPFSGQIGLRRISLGAFVTPGTIITTLDDLSEVKVDFSVPETARPALRQGLVVTASSSVYPGQQFAGTVDSIDPRIDANTRSVQVRARFPNRNKVLAPGMFVAVALVRDRQTSVVVPEGSVIPEQNKQYVFTVVDGKAVRREVEVGHRIPGRVQILSGLIPGERIVIDGALKLRDGMPVDEATRVADNAETST